MEPLRPISASALLWALSLAACAGTNSARQPLPPLLPLPPASEDAVAGAASTPSSDATHPESGPLSLSVEEAVLSTLQRNPDLRVERLTPKINDAFARAARGLYDPELFAHTELGKERAIEISRSTGDQFQVEATTSASAVGLRQEIPTGTRVEVAVEHEYNETNRTPEQQGARVGLTITQALLQGLGPSVNLAAVEQADLEVQASLYELRGYTEAVLAHSEIAYWRFVLTTRAIAIYEESLAVAQKQRDETAQEIEVGTLPQTESAAAEAEVALREQDLIDARSELERRRLELLRLLGAKLARPMEATSDPALTPDPVENLAERIQLAKRSRAEIAEARLRLEQNRLETVMTKNGTLPRLDFFIALGKTGYASDFAGAFGDLSGKNYDVLGGLSFSYFIGNRAAGGAERAAELSRQKAARAIENLTKVVELEVALAVTEVERARQQITASEATRKLQEHKVMVEEERFHVGESTTLLLAQAQRDLLASRIKEVESLVDYRVALVKLYLAEGSLLERRGIRMGE